MVTPDNSILYNLQLTTKCKVEYLTCKETLLFQCWFNVEVQTGSKTSSQQKNKNERLEPMGLPCNYYESSSFPRM
jgi:hypothetical protein